MPASHPSSPKENGTPSAQTRSRPHSKSTLEENAYEDIVGECTGPLASISLRPLAGFLPAYLYDSILDVCVCVCGLLVGLQ